MIGNNTVSVNEELFLVLRRHRGKDLCTNVVCEHDGSLAHASRASVDEDTFTFAQTCNREEAIVCCDEDHGNGCRNFECRTVWYLSYSGPVKPNICGPTTSRNQCTGSITDLEAMRRVGTNSSDDTTCFEPHNLSCI